MCHHTNMEVRGQPAGVGSPLGAQGSNSYFSGKALPWQAISLAHLCDLKQGSLVAERAGPEVLFWRLGTALSRGRPAVWQARTLSASGAVSQEDST